MLGIGSVHARTGAVLAFLCNWAGTFILKPSGAAVVVLAGTRYILSGVLDGKEEDLHKKSFCSLYFLADRNISQELIKIIAVVFLRELFIVNFWKRFSALFIRLVLMGAVNAISVSLTNRLNIVIVACQVTTILVVIIVGLVRIGQSILVCILNNSE